MNFFKSNARKLAEHVFFLFCYFGLSWGMPKKEKSRPQQPKLTSLLEVNSMEKLATSSKNVYGFGNGNLDFFWCFF